MADSVREIIAEVLEVEEHFVVDQLGPDTDGSWDSLNHLRIITAVQQEFGVEFSLEEIQGIRSVGALRELLDETLSKSKEES